MKIIDGFLPETYQDVIETTLLSNTFPWYFNHNTVTLSTEEYSRFPNQSTHEALQFTHAFIINGTVYSDYYQLVSLLSYHLMLTENIDTTKLLRIKSNLNVPLKDYPEGKHYGVHVDYDEVANRKVTTCIYYVNDSDGDTIFFDNEGIEEIARVTPKKGRLVYFDASTPHAGQPPKVTPYRCVININFFNKESE